MPHAPKEEDAPASPDTRKGTAAGAREEACDPYPSISGTCPGWWRSPSFLWKGKGCIHVSWMRANGWAVLIALLYLLTLAILLFPVTWASFYDESLCSTRQNVYKLFVLPIYVLIYYFSKPLFLFVAFLIPLSLLPIPVRKAQGKRIGKRHILWTAFVSAGLAGALSFWGILSVLDTPDGLDNSYTAILPWVFISMWIVWMGIICLWLRSRSVENWFDKVMRWLFAGSVLAIPAEHVARWYNQSNTEGGGFLGLCTSIALAIVAFGPACFMLVWKRWSDKTHARRAQAIATASAPSSADNQPPVQPDKD